MKRKVHTVAPEDDVTLALNIMIRKQVGCLPVVDKDNRLKGVVSLIEVARNVKNNTKQEELELAGKANIVDTVQSLAEIVNLRGFATIK